MSIKLSFTIHISVVKLTYSVGFAKLLQPSSGVLLGSHWGERGRERCVDILKCSGYEDQLERTDDTGPARSQTKLKTER